MNVDLPRLDHEGTLTPLVVEAMKNGATSSDHPTDPDKIVLTFKSAKEAKDFTDKLPKVETVGEEAPTTK